MNQPMHRKDFRLAERYEYNMLVQFDLAISADHSAPFAIFGYFELILLHFDKFIGLAKSKDACTLAWNAYNTF